MTSEKKSNLKRVLSIIVAVILAVCAVSAVATKLIYDGVFHRYDTCAPVPETLSELVKNRTVCRFDSGENLLTGYYYPGQRSGQASGLILLAPGFGAGGDDYLWQIRELTEYGWGVFTFDATGTCRSQGESQIGFSQIIPDLEAAIKYVEKSQLFGYNELVLMGHSRGAYAACCVLAKEQNVAAVVAVSGVNSAMDAIMQMSANVVGPVSYGNYGFLWLYQAMLFGSRTLNLQASEVLSGQAVPVLLIHGNEDDRIPADTGSIVAHREQILSQRVEYLFCDGGHTDILYDADGTANDALMEQIHAFLSRCVGE